MHLHFNRKLFVFLALSFSLLLNSSFSQNLNYKLIRGKSFVQSKNYYLLTLFEEETDVKQLLSSDPVLKKIAKNKLERLSSPLQDCKEDVFCYTQKMKFSDDEIEIVKQRLSALYADNNALGVLVQKDLIPSGTYILYRNLPPKELLIKAWEQEAKGINFTIDVYAEGKKPNYPLIDSMSLRTDNSVADYARLLNHTASLLAAECRNNPLFFTVPLNASLHFLEMNERNRAADYEPMEEKENKAAYTHAKTIDWKKYKYSVIEIPGAGPDDPQMPLSADGMIRCRLAAIQYKNGLAPFIIPSGGKVHPYKTKFCEAIEMKKFLMEQLDVPENAIIIEPHARHTTTNMRNTVRLIYRYCIPLNKPGITCTTIEQSTAIYTTLVARCLKELQETPYKPGNRLSENEVEFYPLKEALQINPYEPMDP